MLQKIKVKLVVSFIKNKSKLLDHHDKKTNTVKTIKYNNFTLDGFLANINLYWIT